ncbi:flotillin family protein, partial [Saccharothrix sp. MB29]|nr:flotillin family protein [Saccharothrix sp. MB29]
GKALIISKVRKVDVTFTGAVVLPVLHRAEVMDISVKTIEIRRAGQEGLICQDNIRADIRITFFVRVNKTVEDVIKVAQAIGTARASDVATLQELFNAKFSEALKTVGKQLDFVDLYTKRDEFRDRIIQVIGTDLNGYSLEDAAIDYLEQTP